MTNHNPTTGIAYGYIAAAHLDSEIVDILMYGAQARNLSYEAACKECEASYEREWQDECDAAAEEAAKSGTDYVPPELNINLDNFDPQIDEPIIEGIYEGVHYRTSWLGGALNFWIFHSPIITTKGRKASPCVPGACILTPERDGDVTGYDVPPDWYFVDPSAEGVDPWKQEEF